MTGVDESKVLYEIPAKNPRKSASLISVLFFRYTNIKCTARST